MLKNRTLWWCFIGPHLAGVRASRGDQLLQEEDGRSGELLGRAAFEGDGDHAENTPESLCGLQDGTSKACVNDVNNATNRLESPPPPHYLLLY